MASDATVNLIIKANARDLARVMQQGKTDLRAFGGEAAAQGRRAEQGFNQAARGADQVARQVAVAKAAVIGFFSIQAAARGLADLRARADGYANIAAKIRLATDTTSEYTAAEAELFAIAQRTSSQLEGTVQLYSRSNAALKEQGRSQSEILGLTETINQAFAVSGASAAEQAGAITQLTQAFSAGALRGEEFNSVNEAAPRLMQALAKSLGVTRGALKAMAEEGELTSEVLFKAFSGEQAAAIAAEFAELPLTIERSFTQLDNAFTRFIGQRDQVTGASSSIAGALQLLANNLGTVVNAVGLVAIVLTSRLIVALGAAIAAKTAAAAATARLAQAEALETAAAHANTQAQLGKVRAFAASNAAVIAAVAATSAHAVAEGRATSVTRAATLAAGAKTVAVRGLSAALSLMGGPIGLVITGIALLIVKFAQASAAAKKLQSDVASALDAADRFSDSEDLKDAQAAGNELIAVKKALTDKKTRLESSIGKVKIDLGGDGAKLRENLRQTEASLAAVNTKLQANAALIYHVSDAQSRGAPTARQTAANMDAFNKSLGEQNSRLAFERTVREKGLRTALEEKAVAEARVKSVDQLSAATRAAIDTHVREQSASDAAKDATRAGAKAHKDAAAEAKRHAQELAQLTQQQREYRAETARLQADNRGDLFGSQEGLNQAKDAAKRDAATAGLGGAELQARLDALDAQFKRGVDQTIETGRIELLQGSGQIVEAATATAQQKYGELIAYLASAGNTAGAQIFQQLFDVDVARAQLQQLQTEYDATLANLSRFQQDIQTQLQAKLITEHEARVRIREEVERTLAAQGQLLPLMDQLAQKIGDPAALQNVRNIRSEMERMKVTVGEFQLAFTNTFQGAVENFFNALATRTASLGDAVKGFFADMARGIAQVAAAQLAQAAAAKLMSFFTKGAGAKDVGAGAEKLDGAAVKTAAAGVVIYGGAKALEKAADKLIKAAAIQAGVSAFSGGAGKKFGGYISGPGTSMSDSIPVRLSDGEFVVRAAAVKRYGIGVLDAINQGRWPSAPSRTVHAPKAHYAEGGLVMGGAAGAQRGIVVNNLLDPSLLGSYAATPEGTDVYINVIAQNPGRVLQALGMGS